MKRAIIILCGLALPLAGCASPATWHLAEQDFNFPSLPEEVVARCSIPEVKRNAKVALLEHRLALRECADKHAAAVAAYNSVRDEYNRQR